ncbi:putative Na+/H+ antiporter [Limnobacter litoralis]|uniref:Membrane protein n=1 Tax=Limnobacter litoralis TaxID=481366 RepID=A0ABQ5YN02_9BURK|nr:putative Na+/H+ antiporter [Limnobacter litoralis]GLR25306.1 membrane protein [Limnobacter litoralis]
MTPSTLQWIAALLFAGALVHTFSTSWFEKRAHHSVHHSGLWHLLGEVEAVFGIWAFFLVLAMAVVGGMDQAVQYVDTRQYTEPLFVFVIMVVAASRPVLEVARLLVQGMAKLLPMNDSLAKVWLGLFMVPLMGSLITEPAAMTLAALLLKDTLFAPNNPKWVRYGGLGVLFVNVSIGGVLTSYAAPPVLMVAGTWNWNTAFMLAQFGWKAALGVLINASVFAFFARQSLSSTTAASPVPSEDAQLAPVPAWAMGVHLLFLVAVVLFAHHPAVFMGVFLFFLGFTAAYSGFQSRLLLKEGLLVAFFLAGLVVLGGMQQWWLQPAVSGLHSDVLFFASMSLTAITDNAALTYLGSLIESTTPEFRYALVAGAVTGGGLTVIANAPNPAGLSLLKSQFEDESVSALGLLSGALLPTACAAACFYWL